MSRLDAASVSKAYSISNSGVKIVTVVFNTQPSEQINIGEPRGVVVRPAEPFDANAVSRKVVNALLKGG